MLTRGSEVQARLRSSAGRNPQAQRSIHPDSKSVEVIPYYKNCPPQKRYRIILFNLVLNYLSGPFWPTAHLKRVRVCRVIWRRRDRRRDRTVATGLVPGRKLGDTLAACLEIFESSFGVARHGNSAFRVCAIFP